MKKIFILMLGIILLIPLCFAQEIKILFPENEVTYGPWSDTYFDYPRTGGKAHHLRINVHVGDTVAYYKLMRNNEYVQYLNNATMPDAVPTDSIIDFKADDLEPLDLIGYLSALQNLTAIAYDENNNEVGRDTIVFYLAVNLDDYYELLSSEGQIASGFAVDESAVSQIAVSEEIVEISSQLFSVKKYISPVTVRNKFTDEVENHTRVEIIVKPLFETKRDISVYTVIPKSVVMTLDEMTLAGNYTVLDADPVMMWHFAAVDSEQRVEYDINLPLETKDAEEIVPIAIADSAGDKSGWYFIIPLVIPIVLLFGIVFFSRFKREK
jgi:hypothetical protein